MAYFTQRDFASPQFEPLTLAQYTKPFEDYAKAYYNIADKYSELGSMSGALETMLNNPNDVNAYNRLLDYNNRLQTEVNDFLDKGLTPYNNRYSDMLKYRNEYNTQFAPLIKDVERRKELVDSQQQMVLNAAARGDNSLIFDVDYNKASVDWVHDHPGHTYKVISLNGVTSDAAAQAEKLSKVFRNLSLQSPFTDDVDLMVKESGLSAMDLLNLDNPSYDHYYDARLVKAREIYDMVVERSGIYGFAGSPNFEGKLRQVQIAAKEGLAQALGVTDFTPLTNYDWRRSASGSVADAKIAKNLYYSNSNLYTLTEEGENKSRVVGKSLDFKLSELERTTKELPAEIKKKGFSIKTGDDTSIIAGRSFKTDYENDSLTPEIISAAIGNYYQQNNVLQKVYDNPDNYKGDNSNSKSNLDYITPTKDNPKFNLNNNLNSGVQLNISNETYDKLTPNEKIKYNNKIISYLFQLNVLKKLKDDKKVNIYDPGGIEKAKLFLTDAFMSANLKHGAQVQLMRFLHQHVFNTNEGDQHNSNDWFKKRDGSGKWEDLTKNELNAFIHKILDKSSITAFDVSGLTDNIDENSIVIEIKPGKISSDSDNSSETDNYSGPRFVSIPLSRLENLNISFNNKDTGKNVTLSDYLHNIKELRDNNMLNPLEYYSAINNVIVKFLQAMGYAYDEIPDAFSQKQNSANEELMNSF